MTVIHELYANLVSKKTKGRMKKRFKKKDRTEERMKFRWRDRWLNDIRSHILQQGCRYELHQLEDISQNEMLEFVRTQKKYALVKKEKTRVWDKFINLPWMKSKVEVKPLRVFLTGFSQLCDSTHAILFKTSQAIPSDDTAC